jgi:hypothetical protein
MDKDPEIHYFLFSKNILIPGYSEIDAALKLRGCFEEGMYPEISDPFEWEIEQVTKEKK